jgi:carboxymethylenebutenolidase
VAKAQLFADELGCLVIAPDTFRGVSSTFIPQCIWLALSTPQQRVNDDLDDAIAWAVAEAPRVAGVVADPKRVAVLGFCYGGGKALRYTTQARPDAATVVWYGNPLYSADELKVLKAPVCGVSACSPDPRPATCHALCRRAAALTDVRSFGRRAGSLLTATSLHFTSLHCRSSESTTRRSRSRS